MGVVTYFVYKFFNKMLGLGFIQEAISLGGSVGVGVIVYVLLVKVFKVEEVDMIIDMVNKKVKKA